jgi:hypothetical protein
MKGISKSRNTAVGIDFSKPRLFLGVLAQLNRVGIVFESSVNQLGQIISIFLDWISPQLLKSDGNLHTVRSLAGVKVNTRIV